MSPDNALDLQYSFFLVDERPFCLWDIDLKKRSLEFLDSLDPSYFEYVANTNLQNVGDDDDARSKESQHAALALRTAYSQALETLFALISASVQAPWSVPAWINLYRSYELRNVIDKIHNYKPLLSQIRFEILEWSSVSEIIFQSLVIEDKEKEAAIKTGFARLWSRFASDFLDEEFTREYNSIKHGLRVRPGGFHVAIGPQSKPGVPAEKMTLLGKSDFGSGYLTADKIGDLNYHLQMKQHHRNWNPDDIAWGLHMASMSISNVKSSIKILNGVHPEQIQFTWPTDLDSLLEPWKRSHHIGVTSMSGFGILIQPDYIEPFSKEKIVANYKEGKDVGIRHLVFRDPPNSNESTTSDS
jgi:hypothetical protein